MCKNLSMKSPVLLFPQFWHWTIWHPWWQDPTRSWHSEAPGNSLQFSVREMSAGSDSGGNLFCRSTLFRMFWAWNPTWCPNFGDWNQLNHLPHDMDPRMRITELVIYRWSNSEVAESILPDTREAWKMDGNISFYCELFVSLSFSIWLATWK